jgi:CheY-like chemotaxis protein
MKCLIVDDNPDILSVLSSMVTYFGHIVDEAGDGLEAIQQLGNNRYDVVITDAEMPRIDGAKLCQHLKSQSPDTYIIGMSGSLAALRRLADAGADMCLPKPFSISKLEEAMANRSRSYSSDSTSLQLFS